MKQFQVLRNMIVASLIMVPILLFSQPVQLERVTDPFNALEITGSARVEISQGAPYAVSVQAAPGDHEMIITKCQGDVLRVSSNGSTNAAVIITSPLINSIKTTDMAVVLVLTPLRQESLKIDASGASQITLPVELNELDIKLSGASSVNISGKVDDYHLRVSGASVANCANLKSKNVVVSAVGASTVRLDVSDNLDGKTSGIANIILVREPKNNLLVSTITSGVITEQEKDSIAKYVEGVMGVIKNREYENIRYENIAKSVTGKVDKSKKKQKFDGHFGGVELGVNTYLNRYNEMSLPAEADYLSLKIPNSLTVHLNVIEGNLSLIKHNLGLVTGLGLEFNNYKFEQSHYIRVVDGRVKAIMPPNGVSFMKSKLSCTYLKVPFMIEYQTNSGSKKNSFHLACGANLGMRLRSHTKYKYQEEGKTVKEKELDRFFLNPYRVAGIVKFGWGPLNFFAEYNLLTLFEQGKGPELYPVSFGMALVNW